MVNYKVSNYRDINIAGEVANIIVNAVMLIKPKLDVSLSCRFQCSNIKNPLFEAGLK
jgi:hypothetical protein